MTHIHNRTAITIRILISNGNKTKGYFETHTKEIKTITKQRDKSLQKTELQKETVKNNSIKTTI